MKLVKIRSARFSRVLLVVGLLFGVFFSFGALRVESETRVDAFGGFSDIICAFGRDNTIVQMYQLLASEDIYFNLFSKSAVSSIDKVDDNVLNSILEVTGVSYQRVNEDVLGRSIYPEYRGDETPPEELPEFNKGAKVNPFDRFGVAGLSWSNYIGEWKYYMYHVCDKEPNIIDPKVNEFYDGRLEPMTTFSSHKESKDPRTLAVQNSHFADFSLAVSTNFANSIFWVTKFIVAITVFVVGLTFGNIGEMFGINKFLFDSGTGTGLLPHLFDNIYFQFIVLVYALFGLWIILRFIKDRAIRDIFSSLGRSLFFFILSIFVATLPGLFVNLPNTIAVIAQGAVISSFAENITTSSGLCETQVGALSISQQTGEASNQVAGYQTSLQSVSQEMRSVIGCVLWEELLLEPWSQGQFGKSYKELWGNNASIPPGGSSLGNNNDAEVGDPKVPVGNGEFVENWAIFQVSTQTNVHSPINHDGQLSRIFNGVNGDWYRVVDALSGYKEHTIENAAGESISVQAPDVKVHDSWGTWIGVDSGRIGLALSSLLIAFFAVLPMLVFAGGAVVAAIASMITMAVAPIMLLFASGVGPMWETFKAWWALLVKLVVTRIVLGILTVLSMIFVSAGLDVLGRVGWWQGFMIIVILSIALIASKNRILEMVTSGLVAGKAFMSSNEKFTSLRKTSKETVASGVVGGIAAKRSGGSFFKGAKTGSGQTFRRHTAYSNQFSRQFYTTKESIDTTRDKHGSRNKFCVSCGKLLKTFTNEDHQVDAYMYDGDYYCQDCYDLGLAPGEAWLEQLDFSKEIQEEKEAEEEAFYRSMGLNPDGTPLKKEQKPSEFLASVQSGIHSSEYERAGGVFKRAGSSLGGRRQEITPEKFEQARDNIAKIYGEDIAKALKAIHSRGVSKVIIHNLPVELMALMNTMRFKQSIQELYQKTDVDRAEGINALMMEVANAYYDLYNLDRYASDNPYAAPTEEARKKEFSSEFARVAHEAFYEAGGNVNPHETDVDDSDNLHQSDDGKER